MPRTTLRPLGCRCSDNDDDDDDDDDAHAGHCVVLFVRCNCFLFDPRIDSSSSSVPLISQRTQAAHNTLPHRMILSLLHFFPDHLTSTFPIFSSTRFPLGRRHDDSRESTLKH